MHDFRATLHAKLLAIAASPTTEIIGQLTTMASHETLWRIADPVGEVIGCGDATAAWYGPLREAMPRVVRRDELVIGGESSTGSGQWVATLGHYVGNFEAPLFGIVPHGKLAFLRVGEFYHIEDGQVAQAVILPDLLDLLRQTGRMPLPHMLGTEMLFPGPATHDGVLPGAPDRSIASLHLVEAMLRDLKAYDPETFDSAGQSGADGYWAEDMLWYGPAGIGANVTYDGFLRDHRIPFLIAFPDRVGGNHFARFGDGDYVASGGWPSMTMTHRGPYLGQPATDHALTLRVMDFWRCRHGRIEENWVLLDYIELFRQMGRDLIAEAAAMA